MNTVNLSDIPGWHKLTTEQIINFMLDNGYNTLLNDYGIGVEYSMDDLLVEWESLKYFKYQLS